MYDLQGCVLTIVDTIYHRRDGVVEFVSKRLDFTQSPVVRPQAKSPERLSVADDESAATELEDGHDADDSVDPNVKVDAEDEAGVEPADISMDPELLVATNVAAFGETDDDNDDELVGILDCFDDNRSPSHESDTFDETNWSEHRIGVTEDRECLVTGLPKAKRVLSYSTLTTLNTDAGHSDECLKRTKCDDDEQLQQQPLVQLELLDFSLGAPAILRTMHGKGLSMLPTGGASYRERGNSCISSDEEELDRQLEQELGECYQQSRENTPIPLLTPPASPLIVDEDDDRVVVCEWPSNLTIDNAMTAILSDIRPMSPQSLEDPDIDEDDNLFITSKASKSTALTPLLRGISVGLM